MAMNFPPRGFGADEANETASDSRWGDPSKLGGGWSHTDRKILLGHWGGRFIGDPDQLRKKPALAGAGDNRHIVTIAGSRAGKSRYVLKPNLERYQGSVVVIDPKGELARETAEKRHAMGQRVFILDPFGITPDEVAQFRGQFNPLMELSRSPVVNQPADAALIADALIVESGGDSKHWTDSAKNLMRGIILHLLTQDALKVNLKELRRSLTVETDEFIRLLEAMKSNHAFDGIVSATGRGFLAKLEHGGMSGELRSILSTAIEQTWPLEDVLRVSEKTDFFLSQLSEEKMTVYLVLPATRLATHFRWLRLLVNLVIAAIERNPVKGLDDGALPVWLVLEEFAALGQMKSIEMAAGFMAGMGCRLWVILQDLTQLQTHYKESWETFLGNAGIIQAWANVDVTTTEYLSKLIGQTTILEKRYDQVSSHGQSYGDLGERSQFRTVPLLDPVELTYHFAREKRRQLILSPSRPPLFIESLQSLEREEA